MDTLYLDIIQEFIIDISLGLLLYCYIVFFPLI
jgi:hypothetical protein